MASNVNLTIKDRNGVINEKTVMEIQKEAAGKSFAKNPSLGEIAIDASEIVSRLEKVSEGNQVNNGTPPQQSVLLGPEQKRSDEIIHIIEGLLSADEDGESSILPVLDETAKLVTSTYSLMAYFGSLERPVLQKLSTQFTADTTRWLSHIFGFLDASAFYHDDQLEGLVRITRMMIHYKYPRYLEDGALALTTALPTIYSSIASPLGIVQHLCKQLGLPLASVRPVPVNTHFGSQYTIDVSALERMLTEDVSAGRTPLVVVADAGTPVAGHVDNLTRIQELCKNHDVWLHLRGHSLAALALPGHQNNSHRPSIADSFTLSLGMWLGIPGLPMITLYRLWEPKSASSPNQLRSRQVGTSRESTLPLIAGLSTDHQGRRILAFPMWVALQSLGRERLHAKIRDAFLSSEKLWAAIDTYKHLRILSQKPGGETGTYTVSELISKPISIPLLFETTATCVVFQFTPEIKEGETLTRVPSYYDKLNTWLGQILQLEAPQVPIDICELENVGVVLRYCPLENLTGQLPTSKDIQTFIEYLEQQIIILIATVQHKETFVNLVRSSPVLRLVELPDWAGLGGVRYVPEGWEQLLTDQAKEELNALNTTLVDALRSTDSAFSLGEGNDGLICVRFGMLTAQSDVEELLNLVIRVGQSVEENSRVLDSMSEIVRKGIETATLDLQKENEERIWQEGILRQVPVVGTFVNWWSPKSKETGVRGRSLNLTQGVVESTENIYKYHMQILSGASSSGTKVTPPPSVQVPVGNSHSRTSSYGSSQASLKSNERGRIETTQEVKNYNVNGLVETESDKEVVGNQKTNEVKMETVNEKKGASKNEEGDVSRRESLKEKR